MAESALVVEVPEAHDLVAGSRAKWDPVVGHGGPTHVTVLYPFRHPDVIDEAVIQAIAAAVEPTSRFLFELTAIDRFAGVIWLRPVPDAPFRRLTDDLCRAFPDCLPYRGAHADSPPHLTVGQFDDPVEQSRCQRQLASELDGRLPVRCVATDVSLFVNFDDEQWTRMQRFELRNERR